MRKILAVLLAAGLTVPLEAAPDGIREKPATTKLSGTLRTGVMAIGAETTGVTLRTKEGVTWELQLTGRLKARAEKLDGKSVVVTGTARERPGVEVRTRRILEVRTLRPSAAARR